MPPAVCLALPLSASSFRASTATTQPTSSSRDKKRNARFLHPSSRTSSERVLELPTLPIFVTDDSDVGDVAIVGIERNRAIPTKWRIGSSRGCVGGSRHVVDWGEPRRAPQLRVDLDFRHWRYKSSVRPLGFVAATIQPKSRANSVLRLCLPLAFD